MGFRDLISFNQSLLAKQAWRILNDSNSLAARIYKAKYFPSDTFLHAKIGNNSSYVWRSLLWGRDLLTKGIRWRVGRGTEVRVFHDPWLLRPNLFKPITIPNQYQTHVKVCELMNEAGEWDCDKVNNLLWEIDRAEVSRIPIGFGAGEDKIIWHYAPKGEYTVKSGYHLAQQTDETNSHGLQCGFFGGLRKLWNLKIPNKIKIHVWRVLFNALPVRANLIGRGVNVDVICPNCRLFPEDILHTFWGCKFVRKVWKLSAIWPLLNSFTIGSFGDLFTWIVDKGTSADFERFVLICWSLWTERNQMVFNGKRGSSEDVIARAVRAGEHFRILSPQTVPHSLLPNSNPLWQPPSEGVLKVNVDAAVFDSMECFGVGIVGRDNRGHLIFAEGRILNGCFPPHVAELLAVKEGVLKASISGWSDWIIETDALKVIQAIDHPAPFAQEEPIAALIRHLCSNDSVAKVQHCSRIANQVAHILARRSLQSRKNLAFVNAIPMFISKFVHQDLLNC